ncbi:TPA: acetyltransferase, partial [Acinetobacter baumannii]
MNNQVYAIYGASGCGRSLMPVARQQLQRQGISAEIYFIDDSLQEEKLVNGHRALNYQSFKSIDCSNKYVLIAIANSQIREKIANQLVVDGIKLWSIQADNTVIMDNVEISEGAAISPFVSITSN